MNKNASILAIDESHISTVEAFGAKLFPLRPIGAVVQGINLGSAQPPPVKVIHALEQIMAQYGSVSYTHLRAHET